jgi:hypothetical protein
MNAERRTRLTNERKEILAELRRMEIKENDSPETQASMLNERRKVKEKLKLVNSAIKAAGGTIRGPVSK